MAQGGIVKFGEWITEGWNLFTKEWKTWALMGLIFLGPIIVLVAGAYIGGIMLAVSNPRHLNPIALVTGGLLLVVFIIGYTCYIVGGMYRAAFKQLQGEKISASDLWSGGEFTVSIFLAQFGIMILAIIGFMLCILPVFIVQGLVFLTFPIIVKEKLGPIEAIKKSIDLCKQDWLMFTLFAFVVGFIAQIGVYACYIGIAVTIPLQFIITAVAYRDCFEPSIKTESAPSSGQTKLCKNCGRTIPAAASFCDNCGAGQA